MHRRWLTRALTVLVVPAVLVPVLATSATAAGGAKVPKLAAVTKIYPHLKGGSSTESAAKVYGPGRKCGSSRVIRGASQRSASYAAAYTSDPSSYLMTGARPGLSATGMRFRTTKAAVKYLHGYAAYAKTCPGTTPGGAGGGTAGMTCTSSTKKIRFTLGNERWGYQLRSTCTISGQKTSSVMNSLFSRKGRFIVYTSAMSMDTSAPSIPRSIALTRLALRTVG